MNLGYELITCAIEQGYDDTTDSLWSLLEIELSESKKGYYSDVAKGETK